MNMTKRMSTALVGYIASAGFIFAAPSPDFSTANARFKAGDFKEAAANYESILKERGPDAAIFYNLGNAYQQLKQYGPAILAYERARALAPRDPDLRANLARARKAAAAFEEPMGNARLADVTGYLSRGEWSWLVAGSVLFLGSAALACGAFKLPSKGLGRLVAGTACLAGISMTAGSAALYSRRAEATRGIIVSENAAVRLSPFENAETVGNAGVGKSVQLGTKNNGFQYFEIPGSEIRGWLAVNDVQRVIPPVDPK